MSVMIRCKMCGADLELVEGKSVATCDSCGVTQTVPAADNEKKMSLFARADRLRRACDFDKAAGVYEAIVAEFPGEAEAYWGLVLCKYGIEYVDDPATGKKIPTCHRSSFDSVMEDTNLDQAVENADVLAQKVYRAEAKQIETVRKGILEVSSREEPYDIFICYKETDENGDRTLDSVMAQDLYDALTDKGYRVFFSRITLEDKLGEAYEPYIFAALNSAKVMLAVGSCFEYYNAVWVKNEWSRYLKLMASDKSKHLIPCYKNLDAYDMPKEFQHLQAVDLGKMGAVQDLLRNMEKYIPRKQTVVQAQQTVVVQQGTAQATEPLLRRAWMFLEERDFTNADAYFEKVLDQDPENAMAYVGKLCAENKLTAVGALSTAGVNAFDSKNYKMALRFADTKLAKELRGYEAECRNYNAYQAARQLQNQAKTAESMGRAKRAFAALGQYKDSPERMCQCQEKAAELAAAEAAAKKAQQERDYAAACKLQQEMKNSQQARQAADAFAKMGDYRDSLQRKTLCEEAAVRMKDEEKRIAAEKARIAAEEERRAREEAAAKAAAEQAARKKKARTIGIVLGAIVVVAVVVGTLISYVFIPRAERKARIEYAESLLAQGSYEEAIDIFGELGDTDRVPEILWTQAEELIAADEDYGAGRVLMSLYEDYGDAAALERYNDVLYTRGVNYMDSGDLESAISCFEDVPEYLDAEELIRICSYQVGQKYLEERYYSRAVTYFEMAGDYENAADMAIYSEARSVAYNDLPAAENLLLQLPRDMEDVDTMLTAIETYRDWVGTYSWKKKTGNHAKNYYAATVTMVYFQDSTMEEPVLDWEVSLHLAYGSNGIGYKAEGAMPNGDTLRFTTGKVGDEWEEFVITKDKILLDTYEASSFGSSFYESNYEFLKEE